LVAAGRIPNTAGIELDLAGVESGSRGYLKVNGPLGTTAPEAWAIGEMRRQLAIYTRLLRRLQDRPG
jgi:pyruvate/2-oxoglutarate dehydrogenase complex dihydrolipoamide dehydrogenase (E3) component